MGLLEVIVVRNNKTKYMAGVVPSWHIVKKRQRPKTVYIGTTYEPESGVSAIFAVLNNGFRHDQPPPEIFKKYEWAC